MHCQRIIHLINFMIGYQVWLIKTSWNHHSCWKEASFGEVTQGSQSSKLILTNLPPPKILSPNLPPPKICNPKSPTSQDFYPPISHFPRFLSPNLPPPKFLFLNLSPPISNFSISHLRLPHFTPVCHHPSSMSHSHSCSCWFGALWFLKVNQIYCTFKKVYLNRTVILTLLWAVNINIWDIIM